MDYDNQMAKLEALLFASGQGLALPELARFLDREEEDVKRLLDNLSQKYIDNSASALFLRKIKNRYLISTKPIYNEFLSCLFEEKALPKLTNAAYEVLAAVAYNQPVTRSQIEAVRGVSSDSVINRLLDLDLIEASGVLDLPGKPSVYVVTERFLKNFGLTSVQDLPAHDMLMYDTIQTFESELSKAQDLANENHTELLGLAENTDD